MNEFDDTNNGDEGVAMPGAPTEGEAGEEGGVEEGGSEGGDE